MVNPKTPCPVAKRLREDHPGMGDPILSLVAGRELDPGTYGLVIRCECGELFTAVSSTEANANKLIYRKARIHFRPGPIGE